MTLNEKDLRTIERALGMVAGVAQGNPASPALYDAVEMIDAVIDGAAERRPKECEWCKTFRGVLRSGDGHYGNAAFCPMCGKPQEAWYDG